MRSKRVPKAFLRLLVLAIGALALVAAGCGGDDDDDGGGTETAAEETVEESSVVEFAVVTPERGNDFGWNQQAVQAAEQVGTELGIQVEVADNSGFDDPTPILRDLSDGGANFIIAHASAYNTAGPDVAAETGVPVLVWDNPEANSPGLVNNTGTASQEGAYLAGVLAANTTETGKLGIVISADDTNWNKMSGGFIAGAQSVDPSIEIDLAQIGQAGYADTAGGKRVTETVIGGGADVIFGMGDGSSFGMLQAVEGADGVSFIDVIGDKTTVDEQGVLLSSVLWNFGGLFTDSISAIDDGTFGAESFELDLENEGIGLLQTELIDDDLWNEIQDVRQQIIDGSIEVPLTEKKGQAEDLIG
jgi:simple sugar transport system substrate-binding protein